VIAVPGKGKLIVRWGRKATDPGWTSQDSRVANEPGFGSGKYSNPVQKRRVLFVIVLHPTTYMKENVMLTLATMRGFAYGRNRINSSLMIVVLLALLAALIPTVPHLDVAPRAQPELIALAQQQPQATIGVIVQKSVTGTDVEQRVTQLGGTITMDLHIINAFAAQLTARASIVLAQMKGVRWVSLDSPTIKPSACDACMDTANLKNVYDTAIGADRLWNEAPKYLQGQGIGVAVVDSGIQYGSDMYTEKGQLRVVASINVNNGYNQNIFDQYGHGLHVAGIVGGNGRALNGAYIGVAPKASLINVKVSDENGAANASNVVAGLQWINDNRNLYNIRVVNLSLNSSVAESYHTNPLDAAVEILWFNKITVVVSSGNIGKNALFPPANDPFVITVGATDDRGTLSTADDLLASYSGYGKTNDGFDKPDLVAPGTNIVSLTYPGTVLAQQHPDHIVSGGYFRMSGTSMSAPMVSGAIALLLQSEPNLTPDQVKYRLMATARLFDSNKRAGAGYINIYAAVHTSTTQSANTGIVVSKLLTSGSNPVNWNSVNWNSVNWNSVNWNSVNWNSVNWNSVNWNSVNW
jgi:serine protease AprX